MNLVSGLFQHFYGYFQIYGFFSVTLGNPLITTTVYRIETPDKGHF